MRKKPVTLPLVIKYSLILMAVFVCVAFLSLLVGPAHIEGIRTVKALVTGWRDGAAALTPAEKTIVFSIRLPRVIFAGFVGAALSTAGVVFQALLRNPLAEPYILGISGGAAVGAICAISLGWQAFAFAVPGLAFLGALLTILLVFAVGRSGGEAGATSLLLAGVIVNAFFSAIIMFLISISRGADLHNITFWLMGDLGLARGIKIVFPGICALVGAAAVYSHARSLNLIVAGEETALQLGVDVERTKIVLLTAASAMTAVAVAFSGIIGFVGLIIPHIMRMLLGPDHRLLLPAAFLGGASFLAAADTLARTAVPSAELPVGVITAFCGAPYFIYLLKRRSL